MTACPDREMALHAMIDGELDGLASVTLEAHLRGCAQCRATLSELEAVRSLIASHDLHYRAPQALHDKVAAMLPAPVSAAPAMARRPIMPWLGGGAAGALAASLAMLMLAPQTAELALADELVANHIRSQQGAHLTDIAASDRHVVRPWFNGRVDFSPPVPDLQAQGFKLAGGRMDVIGGRSVAAIVYKRRLHSINLFVRPRQPGVLLHDKALEDASFQLSHWAKGELEFWAVSEIDAAELAEFSAAYRRATDISH